MWIAALQNVRNVPHKILPITQGTTLRWYQVVFHCKAWKQDSGQGALAGNGKGRGSFDPPAS